MKRKSQPSSPFLRGISIGALYSITTYIGNTYVPTYNLYTFELDYKE